MQFVPSLGYWMGDGGGLDDEQPSHFVFVSEIFVDTNEVNINQWDKVAEWAVLNGYSFSKNEDGIENWRLRKDGPSWYDNTGSVQYPINMINWYDAVKWCNARSEFEGRSPIYFEDTKKLSVYRTNEINLEENNVDWNGSGYRLPTEVEWEKFARGGDYGLSYPWGNLIDGSKANYLSSGDPFDDAMTPINFFNGKQNVEKANYSYGGEDTNPIDMSSKYGLYDLIGNVSEWCWDWYDEEWYGQGLAKKNNSKGPSFERIQLNTSNKLFTRVARGGNFKSNPDQAWGNQLRIAYRDRFLPAINLRRLGIRCVRSTTDDSLWIRKKLLVDFPNWYFLDWFGYFWQSNSGWIFHYELGWIYPSGKGSYDNWLYFPNHGWMWTCKYAYPYIYSNTESTWYQYDESNLEYGWFKKISTDGLFRFGRNYP